MSDSLGPSNWPKNDDEAGRWKNDPDRIAQDRSAPTAVVIFDDKPEHEGEEVALWLDTEVLAHLRADEPGWQTRLNAALRTSAGL